MADLSGGGDKVTECKFVSVDGVETKLVWPERGCTSLCAAEVGKLVHDRAPESALLESVICGVDLGSRGRGSYCFSDGSSSIRRGGLLDVTGNTTCKDGGSGSSGGG